MYSLLIEADADATTYIELLAHCFLIDKIRSLRGVRAGVWSRFGHGTVALESREVSGEALVVALFIE